MKTDIKTCARCGKDHEVEMKQFTNPGNYTHWAMCPELQEPILIIVIEDVL
jgi:hypothetical protein